MRRLPKRPPVPLAVTAFAVFLGACATLSESACNSGDWFSIGAADGARGRTPAYLSNHAEACSRYGITPDRGEWEAGRLQGLRTYCTPATLYAEGKSGREFSPVCPGEDAERLTAAYQTGREYWRIQQRINRLESKLRGIAHDVANLAPDDASGRGGLLLEELRIRNTLLALRREQRNYDRPPVF